MFEFFCAGSFYVSAAWLGLLLIFFSDGGREDDFSHEYKYWGKKKRYFPPRHHSHSSDCRDLSNKDAFSLDQLGEKVLLIGSPHAAFHCEITALRREGLFPSDSCFAFMVMILWGVMAAV